MSDPMVGEDLGARYMAERTAAPGRAALDDMMTRARNSPTKQKGSPTAPAAAPATPDGEGSLAGRVAKDVGMGAIEAPLAVVKGVRDAYQNTINLAGEFGTWVEQAASLPGLKVDQDGIRFVSSKELQALRAAGQQFDFELPDLENPESVTGSLVKNVSQFLTGMKGADKLLTATGIPKMAGAAGYTRTALQGSIANFAVFDPQQQRLSNLVQEVPALANPVSAYLAADPEDGAAEGRFKNAVEGLGFGLLTDGFVKSVRLLRGVARSKAAVTEATVGEGAPGVADDAFKLLGDESDAALMRRPAKPSPNQAPGKTFINFARIDTADDVKKVMQELADAAPPAKDSARAGKRTFEDVKLDAQHEDAWAVLSARREGQPLTDAESLAARQLWVAATDKVVELGELAAANPSKANLFAFRKMLAIHDDVQREVLGARASAARSLASWRIPAGGSAERLRDVVNALDVAGGSEVAEELAMKIAGLGRAGFLKEANRVIEKGAYARTRDAVLEVWVGGLLSNPLTHMRNVVSNTLFIPINMAERAVAARLSSFFGDGAIEVGEASQQFYGIMKAIPDAFRFAAKAAKTLETGMGVGRIELPRKPSMSSEALRLSSSGWLGRGADALGSAYRLTSRGLMAEDEFFKTVGYRAQLHALALRQATNDVHAGRIPAADLTRRIGEIVENPPENLRMAAVDHATYMTFQQSPEWFGKLLMSAKHKAPGFNVLLPFVRTTTNLQRATFERTPLAFLVGQWKADIRAGGARRDLALARMGLGSMATLAIADLALSGRVSGRGPRQRGQREALMREGWKPYSVRVGDRWYSYSGTFEPLSGMIGLTADATEILMQAQEEFADDPDIESMVTATAAAIGGNMLNKSYLEGFSSFIEALNDGGRGAQRYFEGLAASGVPSGVGHGARLNDPILRHVDSMGDAIRARIPGLSDNLPPRRDLWGEPISRASGFGKVFDALSPVTSSKPTPEPIDQEILKQGLNINLPSRVAWFDGVTVQLSSEQYSRYVELAGNELKHPAWNMGAKDFLNAVVSGKHPLSPIYNLRSDGPDGGKDVFIREKLNDYRKRARAQLIEEFPDLAERAGQRKAEKDRRRAPAPAPTPAA